MRRIFFGLFLLCTPLFALADGTISLGMTPQYPLPGQNVTLTASNFSGSADTASYTWTINGKTALQGTGAKTLTVAAGAAGSSQEVTVEARVNGESIGTDTVTIHPADVDLIWEGQTVTPPLYIGRPLANGGSRVTILAVPHIFVGSHEAAPDSLIYTWKINGATSGSQSGYGKSSIVVTPPSFAQAFTVSVHVETKDGAAAEGSVVIQPQSPKILIYENAPLLGIRFDSAVSGFMSFPAQEISFTAYPLFVSTIAGLKYSWTLDGNTFAVDTERPRDVTFRKVGDTTSGTHTVTLSFQNPNNFLENGAASFKLTF